MRLIRLAILLALSLTLAPFAVEAQSGGEVPPGGISIDLLSF